MIKSPTLTLLALTPPDQELVRMERSRIVADCFDRRRLRVVKGRHERLAAKHRNAAEAARSGLPTPPVTATKEAPKFSMRCAKLAMRENYRAQRLTALSIKAREEFTT